MSNRNINRLSGKSAMMPISCMMCHGDMVNGTTTFTYDLGFGVIVVRQVPAQVCSMCGAEGRLI